MDMTAQRDIRELEKSAGEAAKLLSALANERRLLILCMIVDKEVSVGELQAQIGISQSALSQHLAILRTQGLVVTRRESQTIYYRLASTEARQVIELLALIYCPPEI
ncbi:MAG: metalloregulator ArsR/SmtB family transcription factor [Rhizobiales bacterium]|nr:metalloregulator ArsR/SmtB family transcription factor [Hyphomicrobiales bacterium]